MSKVKQDSTSQEEEVVVSVPVASLKLSDSEVRESLREDLNVYLEPLLLKAAITWIDGDVDKVKQVIRWSNLGGTQALQSLLSA